MSVRTFLAGLLLVVSTGATGHLLACGDKFLNLSLGTSYESSPADRRAAAILIYADSGSDLQRSMTTLSVEAGLRRHDYRPTIVGSPAELDGALNGAWDIVIVDAKDSQTVSLRIQGTGGPHVVPVLTRPTRDELKAAKARYHVVVNMPARTGAFIDAIEDAMYLHEVEAAAAAKAAKKATR